MAFFDGLAPELKEGIFAFLDLETLAICEQVCRDWLHIIRTSPHVYPSLWKGLVRTRPTLRATLRVHLPPRSPPFHRYARSLHALHKEGFQRPNPLVTVIECPIIDNQGQRIEVSETWSAAVNFTGVGFKWNS